MRHFRRKLVNGTFSVILVLSRRLQEVTVRVASNGDPSAMINVPIDSTGTPLPHTNKWTPLLLCKFTLVAKDRVTNRPVKQINKLVPTNANEARLIEQGRERK